MIYMNWSDFRDTLKQTNKFTEKQIIYELTLLWNKSNSSSVIVFFLVLYKQRRNKGTSRPGQKSFLRPPEKNLTIDITTNPRDFAPLKSCARGRSPQLLPPCSASVNFSWIDH